MERPNRIYVDPSFKKQLKRMAADTDMTILSLTKELAKSNKFVEIPKHDDFKRFKFSF